MHCFLIKVDLVLIRPSFRKKKMRLKKFYPKLVVLPSMIGKIWHCSEIFVAVIRVSLPKLVLNESLPMRHLYFGDEYRRNNKKTCGSGK